MLVATQHKRYQRFISREDSEDTRKAFEKALTLAFIKADQPKCPPVIFIGFEHTGADVQHKVANAPVTVSEGLMLDQFVHGTCCKCAANYLSEEDKPSHPENQTGVEFPSKDKEHNENKQAHASAIRCSFLNIAIGKEWLVVLLMLPHWVFQCSYRS